MMPKGIGALGKLHCTQMLSCIGHMSRAQPAAARKFPSATNYDGISISFLGQFSKDRNTVLTIAT